jgi:hypothetical protein
MANLLDTLGKKDSTPASGVSSEAPVVRAPIGNGAPSESLARGQNLISNAAGSAEVEVTTHVATETTESAIEATRTVADPDTWSKDSALKEVVKLREENRAVRTKFQEQLDKIQKETDAKIAQIQESAKTANEAQKRLEALEASAEDKKRSIEEKLANREARITETELLYKQKLDESAKEVETYRNKALQYEAEQEARREVYRVRIKEELSKVPEELRTFADKMVQGYSDPHEGWLAIAEAGRKGMFGEKKVVVNHAVPGANDGARLSNSQAKEAEAEARKKKDSKTLIRNGLQKMSNGTPNSAFRTK